MAISSETQIVNNALLRLGASTITSMEDDGTVSSNAALQLYAPTRDSLLRKHFWNFAIARQNLASDVTSPDFQFLYQYTLPADFSRVQKIYGQTSDYSVEGTKLLTNQAAPLRLVYVRQVTDVRQFDSLFVEVLVLMLAIKMSNRIRSKADDINSLKEELRTLLLEAKIVDAQDSSPEQFDVNTFLDARMFGTQADWISERIND